jgi:hypothetical protein
VLQAARNRSRTAEKVQGEAVQNPTRAVDANRNCTDTYQLMPALGPEGTMRRVPKRWEAYYLVDGKHRDLIADLRAAADWCEAQLSTIEPHVPIINLPSDAVIDWAVAFGRQAAAFCRPCISIAAACCAKARAAAIRAFKAAIAPSFCIMHRKSPYRSRAKKNVISVDFCTKGQLPHAHGI